MHLEPFHNYVVLRLLAEPRTHGLVEAVALEERPSAHATVVAIGPDCRDVQRGDRVLVSRLQGFTFGEFTIVRESAILAHL